MKYFVDKGIVREAVINGKRVPYDACSSRPTLKAARASYDPKIFKYIGSGRVMYFNGVHNSFNEKHWFFVRKETQK